MTTPCDIKKRREIVFHPYPEGQAEQARALLSRLPALEARCSAPQTLEVAYCIGDHTLERLEAILEAQGFHLFNTLLIRLKRALIYYSEGVQLENMSQTEVNSKNYQAFVTAWDQQPHGDHDDTPAEWRQYR